MAERYSAGLLERTADVTYELATVAENGSKKLEVHR